VNEPVLINRLVNVVTFMVLLMHFLL